MKITGTATLEAGPDQVWDAFHDPAVLARCLPGCERLTDLGEDRYAMTITAGVAAIRGTYDGEVALQDPERPGSFTMKASGAGGPGTVDARVLVRLSPGLSGGTDLVYDADASVGGAIGGVGQRMLSGVTRRMAGQFFSAIDAELTGVPTATVVVNPADGPIVTPGTAAATASAATMAFAPAESVESRTFAGRSAGLPAASGASGSFLDGTAGFAVGVLTGGVLSLLGVALGARLAGRH